jgi:Na+-transporting NADH:ubiquinone oxidoreductase subunit NqrD
VFLIIALVQLLVFFLVQCFLWAMRKLIFVFAVLLVTPCFLMSMTKGHEEVQLWIALFSSAVIIFVSADVYLKFMALGRWVNRPS